MSEKIKRLLYNPEKVFLDVQQAIKQGADSLNAISGMTGYKRDTIKKYVQERIELPIGKKGRPKGTKKEVKRIKKRDILLKNGRLSLAEIVGDISRQGIYDYIKRTMQYDERRREREKYYI